MCGGNDSVIWNTFLKCFPEKKGNGAVECGYSALKVLKGSELNGDKEPEDSHSRLVMCSQCQQELLGPEAP